MSHDMYQAKMYCGFHTYREVLRLVSVMLPQFIFNLFFGTLLPL